MGIAGCGSKKSVLLCGLYRKYTSQIYVYFVFVLTHADPFGRNDIIPTGFCRPTDRNSVGVAIPQSEWHDKPILKTEIFKLT